MVLTEPLTLLGFGIFKKIVFFLQIFFANSNSRHKKSLANEELLKNRGLYRIARHQK